MENTPRQDALIRSKTAVDNDEYYTRQMDIDEEMVYHNHDGYFKGKKVLCNCNDGDWSSIYQHFNDKFEDYELEALMGTIYNKGGNGEVFVRTKQGKHHEKLEGDGSYDSDELCEMLDSCDIVVTNPPFSMFTHFLPFLVESGKDFIVLGPCTAVSKKDIFPYIRDGKVSINHKQITKFQKRDGLECDKWDTEKQYRMTGTNSYWYSTLKGNHPRPVPSSFSYDAELHPKYAGADIIDVNSIKRMPTDYYGLMAVPLTYLDKHNPDYFTLVGASAMFGIGKRKVVAVGNRFQEIKKPVNKWEIVDYTPSLHNNKDGIFKGVYKDVETGKLYKSVFNRLIIRRNA